MMLSKTNHLALLLAVTIGMTSCSADKAADKKQDVATKKARVELEALAAQEQTEPQRVYILANKKLVTVAAYILHHGQRLQVCKLEHQAIREASTDVEKTLAAWTANVESQFNGKMGIEVFNKLKAKTIVKITKDLAEVKPTLEQCEKFKTKILKNNISPDARAVLAAGDKHG